MITPGPSLVSRCIRRLRHGGGRWLWYALRDRLAPVHPTFLPQAREALLHGAILEIGGPSRVFGECGALPAYRWAKQIDNVNFATQTAWEQTLAEGGEFRFSPGKAAGVQMIREATRLEGIPNQRYDGVLSAHCLEHIANPLTALAEWLRVTKTGGHLMLVLPDPTQTFDHRRPSTPLPHLRSDRDNGVEEDDQTHFDEVLALHDLNRDPGAGSFASFRERVMENARYRCVHHHVFDLELLGAVLRETGWSPVQIERFPPIHLGALARKIAP